MKNKNLRASLLAIASLPMVAFAQSPTVEIITGAGRYVDVPGTTVPVAPNSIAHLAAGPDGQIYVTDINSKFLRLNPITGTATALPANDASLNFKLGYTTAIAFDSNGAFYSASEARLLLVDPNTGTRTDLGFFWTPEQMAFAADGTLYFVASPSQIHARLTSGAIVVIAGTDEEGFSGDGGPALLAQLSGTRSLAIGPQGDVYVADTGNHRIRKISVATGLITTIAGTGDTSFNGNGNPATATNFNQPTELAFDSAGNLYVSASCRIRRIEAMSGLVSHVIGMSGASGSCGDSGDGGPASLATINNPQSLAVGSDSDLFFADTGNTGRRHVRQIDSSTGIVTRVLGNNDSYFCGEGVPARFACFIQPYGLAIDPAQNLVITDIGNQRIRRLSADTGHISTLRHVPPLNPLGIEYDAAGNLYMASFGGYQINRIDAVTGVMTRVAGTGGYGAGPNNVPATSSSLMSPTDVALDAAGNLFIADDSGRVRKVDAATGIITTVTNFTGPATVEFDPAGNLVIGGQQCILRRVDAVTGVATTIAGTGTCAYQDPAGGTLATATNIGGGTAFTFDPSGNIYLGWSGSLYRIDSATGIMDRIPSPVAGLTTADGVSLRRPSKMKFDAAGRLFITESDFGLVFRVSGLLPSESTPPVIVPVVDGDLGNDGWRTSIVYISWNVTDPESPVTSSSGCGATTFMEDTAGTTFTCTATSSGGTSSQSVTIRRDGSVPAVHWSIPFPAPAAPGSGWFNQSVYYPVSVTDDLSGVAYVSHPSPILVSAEGAGSMVGGFTVRDNAGNTASMYTPPVNIDRTPPMASITVPAAGATYGAYTSPLANYSCTDALSGIGGCNGTVAHGAALATNTSGAKSFTVTATDVAGNVATLGQSYTVAPLVFERFIEPLRRSPTFNGVTAGSLVPIRWRLLSAGQAVTNPAAFQSFTVLNLTCQGTAIALTDTATGGPGLSVNPANGYFTYNWQTDASWAGTCRRVQIRLGDNSVREVVFRFN